MGIRTCSRCAFVHAIIESVLCVLNAHQQIVGIVWIVVHRVTVFNVGIVLVPTI